MWWLPLAPPLHRTSGSTVQGRKSPMHVQNSTAPCDGSTTRSTVKRQSTTAILMGFAGDNLSTILLCFGLLLLIVVLSPSFSHPFTALSRGHQCDTREKVMEFPKDELDDVLERAATPNKTVVIAIVNKAYAEAGVQLETTMLDLFLESFWLGESTRGILDHLVLVALDQAAYERCKFKRLHCHKLEGEDSGTDFGGEKVFMSAEFIKMMWSRTRFLLELLKRGYSFIFTDMDVMWLRNPFLLLDRNTGNIDLQISVDFRESKNINTGFYFIRSNNKTISLFNIWYQRRHNSTGLKEQDVLLDLLRSGVPDRLNVTVRFLDTTNFSGFCQESRNISSVATVHANCCRHIRAKVDDLSAILRDWKKYKAITSKYNLSTAVGRNVTKNFRWSPHQKCSRSWLDAHYKPLGKK